MKLSQMAALAAVGLAATLAPPAARAELELTFNVPFSNSSVPSGAAPWLSAQFEDVDATHVRLTLTNLLQSSTEFITAIKFNVSGDAMGVTVAPPVTGTGVASYAGFSHGNDAFRAAGSGRYDLRFSFRTANSGDRFTAGDTLIVMLTRIAGLTAGDFEELSSGASGTPFYAAAHVQGIGPSDESTLIGAQVNVPEPAAVILFGSLLAGIGFVKRRR